MDAVPLVGGRKLRPALLERIRREVVEESDLSRSEFARRVCSWLDSTDPAGRPKETTCRIALLGLSRRGSIELPAARGAIAALDELVGFSEDERESLDCPVAELRALRAVVVTAADRLLNPLWKRLMTHHYLVPGPPVCAQVRYLVESEGARALAGSSGARATVSPASRASG